MKLLINAANLRVGGGVQVARRLLRQFEQTDISVKACLSPELSSHLDKATLDRVQASVIERSPSSSLRALRELYRIARGYRPSICYSIFGPTLFRPDCFHAVGIANPWILRPSASFWKEVHAGRPGALLSERLRWWLSGLSLRWADALIVELERSRSDARCLSAAVGDRIAVIPNAADEAVLGPPFARADVLGRLKCANPRGIFVAHGYRHKNHAVLPRALRVMCDLMCPTIPRIALTLPADSWRRLRAEAAALNVDTYLVNLGPLHPSQLRNAYEQAAFVVAPSLAETSSAAYLEALHLGLPIVASDRDFARESCGSFATYCDPLDAASVAKAMGALLADPAAAADRAEAASAAAACKAERANPFWLLMSVLRAWDKSGR